MEMRIPKLKPKQCLHTLNKGNDKNTIDGSDNKMDLSRKPHDTHKVTHGSDTYMTHKSAVLRLQRLLGIGPVSIFVEISLHNTKCDEI